MEENKMKTLVALLLFIKCLGLCAQTFKMTDNIRLNQITDREYAVSYKKSKKSCARYTSMKRGSQKMKSLLGSTFIWEKIERQWGRDFDKHDDFFWGYYKLDSVYCGFSYMVIVNEPINPHAYLLRVDSGVDSVSISGDGVLTRKYIYFTQQMFDGDESFQLDWYAIRDKGVKAFGELSEETGRYRGVFSDKIPSCFVGFDGNYYFAIEDKTSLERKYYVVYLE